jgi:hypothetical protein
MAAMRVRKAKYCPNANIAVARKWRSADAELVTAKVGLKLTNVRSTDVKANAIATQAKTKPPPVKGQLGISGNTANKKTATRQEIPAIANG